MDARTRDRAYARITIADDIVRAAKSLYNIPSWRTSVEGLTEQPELAARALRAEWGLGDRPIKSVVRLLESRGVAVFSIYDDPLCLDAFSCWLEAGPTAFLSLSKTGQRQRFDGAHELGHIILHQGVDQGDRKAEQEADRFAAEFLMPAEAVIAVAPRNPGLRELNVLRHKFGVSIPAIAYRFHALRMISEWQYKNLCIQISEQGLRTSDPEAIAFETSSIWKSIFSELRRRGELDDFCMGLGQPYAQLSEHVFRPLPVVLRGVPHLQPQLRNVR